MSTHKTPGLSGRQNSGFSGEHQGRSSFSSQRPISHERTIGTGIRRRQGERGFAMMPGFQVDHLAPDPQDQQQGQPQRRTFLQNLESHLGEIGSIIGVLGTLWFIAKASRAYNYISGLNPVQPAEATANHGKLIGTCNGHPVYAKTVEHAHNAAAHWAPGQFNFIDYAFTKSFNDILHTVASWPAMFHGLGWFGIGALWTGFKFMTGTRRTGASGWVHEFLVNSAFGTAIASLAYNIRNATESFPTDLTKYKLLAFEELGKLGGAIADTAKELFSFSGPLAGIIETALVLAIVVHVGRVIINGAGSALGGFFRGVGGVASGAGNLFGNFVAEQMSQAEQRRDVRRAAQQAEATRRAQAEQRRRQEEARRQRDANAGNGGNGTTP